MMEVEGSNTWMNRAPDQFSFVQSRRSKGYKVFLLMGFVFIPIGFIALHASHYVSANEENTKLKHGSVLNAVRMLSRAEKSVDPESKKLAHESLMVLYGDAGKARDVYRMWNMYKDRSNQTNHEQYRLVISILLKMNDISGARKIFQERYLGDVTYGYDIRTTAMIASAYCERGQLKEAEEIMGVVSASRTGFSIARSIVVAMVYILYKLASLVIFFLKDLFGCNITTM